MEKAFISIIIYVYNVETQNVLDKLFAIHDNLLNTFENFELIIVNDASTDDTEGKIRSFSQLVSTDISLVNLTWKHGPDNAIFAGIDLAIGDFIVEIEMDKMDFPVEIISQLFEEAANGYDIVSAVPKKNTHSGMSFFYFILNKFSTLPFPVERETLRIVSRRALNAILGIKERVRYRKILYQYSGFPNTVIRYEPICKATDYSKMSFWEKLDFIAIVFISYSHIGPLLSFFLSLVFLLFSIILGFYAIIMHFFLKNTVEGWTTMMLFLSAGFSGIFVLLAIQSRYLSTALYEIKGRPLYSIKSYGKLKRNDK